MVCTKCGKSLGDNASFCGGCGANLKELNADYTPKSEKKSKPSLKVRFISKEDVNIFVKKVKKFVICLSIGLFVGFVAVTIIRYNSDFDFKVEKGVLMEYNGKNYAIYTPETATTIGEWSFSDQRSVKTITVNEAVTKISHGAFEGCTSLTMITIPPSVTEIGDWILAECWSLTTVCVKAGSYADAWAKTYNFHSNVTIEYY